MKDIFSTAVDFGHELPDKQPVFGPSKTWRGLVAALIVTAASAWLMGYTATTGLLVAIYAISGDLLSSFIKRRLGLQPSSMALLLDQIPESLLPALMMMQVFSLNFVNVIELVLIFVILELLLSQLLYRVGIRNTPF